MTNPEKGWKSMHSPQKLTPFSWTCQKKGNMKKKCTRDLPVPDLPFHLISTLHKMLKKNYCNKEYAYYYKQWLVRKAKVLNFCPGDREVIDIGIKCPNPKSHTWKRIRIPLVVLSIMYNFPPSLSLKNWSLLIFQMLMVMVGAIDYHCPNSSQSEWNLEVGSADLEEEQENHSQVCGV